MYFTPELEEQSVGYGDETNTAGGHLATGLSSDMAYNNRSIAAVRLSSKAALSTAVKAPDAVLL